MNDNWLVSGLLMLIPLWMSLSVHEWAHAWAAWRLGDDTAARMGRMTLNPLAHIDPVGTLLLPLLGIPFGWAKPVPVQPHRFRMGVRMSTGMMLVALAGPIANLVLALLCMVATAAVIRFQPALLESGQAVSTLLQTMIFLNVILATFNALPIPPLDGSRVVDALVPQPLRPIWESLCSMGPLALAAVILVPRFVGLSLFAWPIEATRFLLREMVALLGG